MGLREQTRTAVRNAIADQALALFGANGFEETTVEDIAAAVGISSRSFFRYFPVKEDVVLGDAMPLGDLVRDALVTRPAREAPWQAMRAALEPIVEAVNTDPQRTLRVMRVINNSASLRARNLEKHNLWTEALTPIMTQRLKSSTRSAGAEPATLPARAIIAAALSCLDVAFAAWTATDGAGRFADILDLAFASVTR